jgi:hypothetical protein
MLQWSFNMKRFFLIIIALFTISCTNEIDYCRAFCQKAGTCYDCGGEVDMDGCINECKSLDTSIQKKLVDCYDVDEQDCSQMFLCSEIIDELDATSIPSPCTK